jgi:hypothetical protein
MNSKTLGHLSAKPLSFYANFPFMRMSSPLVGEEREIAE